MKKFNGVEQFLAYVNQLNFVKVDGDTFVADNGARLNLQYKLMVQHGISGVQLILGLFASSEGGHVVAWGSENDASNKVIAEWWIKKESVIREAQYERQENAVKELTILLNG